MEKDSVKYIIKTIFLILVISLITDKIVFLVLNKVSDKVFTGQSIGKLNHYLMIKDNVDLVVFGSSRANHHIDPIILSDKSFNKGMDGQKLAFSATLIKLLPKNKKQLVLLHIDPENAFSSKYTGKDIQSLSSKYNRNKTIKSEIDKLKQNNFIQKYYPSLSYNGSVLGILKNYFIPNYNYKTYSGYDPLFANEIQKNIFKNILEKGVEKTNCQNKFILNKIYSNYLNEIKIFCKKNKKKLIVFTSPKYNNNNSCEEENIKFAEIMKTKNFDYYDLTNFFKNANALKYWKDKTHLSNIGATLFTSAINDTIKLKD